MKQIILVLLAFVVCSCANPLFNELMNDEEPDRHPFVQCKIDLYDCTAADKKGNILCLKDYKNCMSVLVPTIPPFVHSCKGELSICNKDAADYWEKAQCYVNFAECLKNGL